MFAALEAGIEVAREYFADRSPDPWLFAHIVRDQVIQSLLGVDGDFTLEEMPMSGIEISCGEYCVRCFKKCGSDSDFLYPPGHSQGRQDFYSQVPLPGMSSLMRPFRNLAYVWEAMVDGLELWLVCPDGFDGIWKPGRSRWTIPIPHPALSMESQGAFEEDTDDQDLPIDLDDAESDPDDSA